MSENANALNLARYNLLNLAPFGISCRFSEFKVAWRCVIWSHYPRRFLPHLDLGSQSHIRDCHHLMLNFQCCGLFYLLFTFLVFKDDEEGLLCDTVHPLVAWLETRGLALFVSLDTCSSFLVRPLVRVFFRVLPKGFEFFRIMTGSMQNLFFITVWSIARMANIFSLVLA